MKATRLFLAALLMAALSSCSIKEDRDPCPCVLDIFLEDSGDHAERLALSAWDGTGRLFLDRIDTDKYPDIYQKKVPKGFLNVCAYGGVSSMALKGDWLLIPEGGQCDPVWAYKGGTVDANGETAEDHITLHKQYAVIHIRLDSLGRDTGGAILRAVGNANGFDISTLEPVKGPFHSFTSLDKEMHHVVSVPRQFDGSLELEVYLEGVLSRTVLLGELILNAGYSWEREDLDDIYISLGLFSSGRITISVNGWDTEAITFKY